jgi:hypothetical protein
VTPLNVPIPEADVVQVYWNSVSDFAKQPISIRSEFLKELPMFGSMSNDLLLFMACIVECLSPRQSQPFCQRPTRVRRHRQLLKGRELIKYGSLVSISNHPVLFVMKGSVSMKTAVAQLGKDVVSTAKQDPGLGFVERRQQMRLQVMNIIIIATAAPAQFMAAGVSWQRCFQQSISACFLAGTDGSGRSAV